MKKTRQKYAANSVEIVCIAVDNVSKVLDFCSEVDIDYGVLVGGAEALAASRDLGNRADVLPHTVILDQARRVACTYAGALSEAA